MEKAKDSCRGYITTTKSENEHREINWLTDAVNPCDETFDEPEIRMDNDKNFIIYSEDAILDGYVRL